MGGKKDPFDEYGGLTGGYDLVQAREWALKHAEDNLPQRHSFLRDLPPQTTLIWEVPTSRFVEDEDCYEVVVACYPDGPEVQAKAEWTYHVDVKGKPAPGTPVLKARGRWDAAQSVPGLAPPAPVPPTTRAIAPGAASPASTAQEWFGRGYKKYLAEDWEGAIADCTKAIELNPKYDLCYAYRGHAYCDLGQYKEAIADYTRTIQLNPKNAFSYINRGKAYNKLGRLKEAQADLSKAEELRKARGAG